MAAHLSNGDTMFFNPFKSKDVDQNIERTDQDWKDEYERLFIQFCHETEYFDGSQPCDYARRNGLWEPHHHNCWVSGIVLMRGKGYIQRVVDDEKPMFVNGSAKHSHNNNVGKWHSLLYRVGAV
jgi:hypothetical protein